MEKLIALFNGGYNRVGEIKTEIATCNVCNISDKCVISIDASEKEYKKGSICFDCIEINKPVETVGENPTKDLSLTNEQPTLCHNSYAGAPHCKATKGRCKCYDKIPQGKVIVG